MTLLILEHPGHNQMYFEASAPMALAELELGLRKLSVGGKPPELVRLGGVRYLRLELDGTPSEADLGLLAGLSFTYALFQLLEADHGPCLKPLARPASGVLDNKLSSLLKYKGKTNENFTRLLLSVAGLSAETEPNRPIRLLDPVAGRGTTLYEAAIKGYEAQGIELDPKAVHEGFTYFKKFLEKERIKHQAGQRRVAGRQKSDAVMAREILYTPNLPDGGKSPQPKTWALVQGDSRLADTYFKKASFELIAGDLPYGIAHTSKNARKGKGGSRNTLELVRDCLPAWKEVLVPGGAIALSWNTRVTPRKDMEKAFREAGFEVLTEGPYQQFDHRVDQAIQRDILVALRSV
ncbi:TRM11 family SAM-dependent methyltransferase [Robiginitalea sediminis]|uniref:TRM11 family SAM-dependent methyltransferase n=1 Tax=Robiginitalea sediminis TaxID=1982593 RepID=UPI000B4A98D4|nr:hypothetical protein [Robiginitalea sediminis]